MALNEFRQADHRSPLDVTSRRNILRSLDVVQSSKSVDERTGETVQSPREVILHTLSGDTNVHACTTSTPILLPQVAVTQ